MPIAKTNTSRVRAGSDRTAAQAKERQVANGGDKTAEVEKIPPSGKGKSRDEAGKAAGIISEQSKKKIIHSGKAPVF